VLFLSRYLVGTMGPITKGTTRALLQDHIHYFPINVFARVFTEFQQLGVNETIGENLMFSDILHDFETVLGHKVVVIYCHLSELSVG
jgi:hypothetical protein